MGVSTRGGKRTGSTWTTSLAASKRPEKILKSSSPSPEEPLLILSSDCVEATMVCRPSKRNRSPYVADVFVPSLNRQAICHVPSLDMGGKCIPGVRLWIQPQRLKNGDLLGPDAVSPKYGTPKCEFIARLVHVDESGLSDQYTPTWVGAHPSLGEKLAASLIERHIQGIIEIPGLGPIESYRQQVTIGPHTRADFVLETTDKSKKSRIVEVKTVVDTDYNSAWPLPDRAKCVFTSNTTTPYRRTAIFPWGQSKQKGPDGEAVVSARAIKHVRELTDAVAYKEYQATVLFLVVRDDAQVMRPNHEACPSFCKYLQQAQQKGVQILAKRVRWDDNDIGKCYDDGWLDINFPVKDS